MGIVAQVAKAMTYLHQQGLALARPEPSHWEATVEKVITHRSAGAVKLADLSGCTVLREASRSQQIAGDVAFLGRLLLYLTSDVEGIPSDPLLAAPAQCPYVAQALQGAYATPMTFLNDLTSTPAPALTARPLTPNHGQASDPGRKHSHNEDAVVTFTYNKELQGRSVPIGFYLVADGMGGHAAGDVASRTVNEIVTEWVLRTKVLPDLAGRTRLLGSDGPAEELLTHAVKAANVALVRQAKASGSDLGSTVTAALILGNCATIVNVGDSRTYLLRDGVLEQITEDHSLVARLVDAQIIEPDQVRSHPQRNQIYRSLGHHEEVAVDTFDLVLRRHDRLILCSDGLWEMVPDARIQQIVEESRSPQQACYALVATANEAGSDDNISVVIVAME